jgi:hypothetical protein
MLEEDDLSGFESSLRTLRPRAGQVDPIAAAFAAGQRTRERSRRRWQCGAAVALVLGLAAHLPRLARTGQPGSPQPLVGSSGFVAPAQSEQSLQFLQQTVQDRGVDALPMVRLPPLQAVRAHDIL